MGHRNLHLLIPLNGLLLFSTCIPGQNRDELCSVLWMLHVDAHFSYSHTCRNLFCFRIRVVGIRRQPFPLVLFVAPSTQLPPRKPWNRGIGRTEKTELTEKSKVWGDQGNECISTPRSCLGQKAKVGIGLQFNYAPEPRPLLSQCPTQTTWGTRPAPHIPPFCAFSPSGT